MCVDAKGSERAVHTLLVSLLVRASVLVSSYMGHVTKISISAMTQGKEKWTTPFAILCSTGFISLLPQSVQEVAIIISVDTRRLWESLCGGIR